MSSSMVDVSRCARDSRATRPCAARDSSSAGSSRSRRNTATLAASRLSTISAATWATPFRQLRRSPGFALLAVLCLGLGIGVNTSIFGVLNAVLLRPMPVADPDRLIRVSRGQTAAFSYPDLSGLPGPEPRSLRADRVASRWNPISRSTARASSWPPRSCRPTTLTSSGVRPSLGRWFVNDDRADGGHQPCGLAAPVQSESGRPGPPDRLRIAVLHDRRRGAA